MVLKDNGSALNVCPLKVATEAWGIIFHSFWPDCSVENTKREVLGVATLDVSIGPHDRGESMKILSNQSQTTLTVQYSISESLHLWI